MFQKIRNYYSRSVKVHMLLGRVEKAAGFEAKMALLRQVKVITTDNSAAPPAKWAAVAMDGFIANIRPLLLPFGANRPLFLARFALVARRAFR